MHGRVRTLALTDDRGRLLWVSAARPGRSSEISVCRHDQLTAKLRAAGLGGIADLGFVGLDDSGPDADPTVITGYKAARNRPLTRGQILSNKALAAVRAPVEHGFAHLKNWRVLAKVRTDPKRATDLIRALLVLTNREVSRWPTIFNEVIHPRPARVSRTRAHQTRDLQLHEAHCSMGHGLTHPLATALRDTALRPAPSGLTLRAALRHADWAPPRLR
ncbi:transposase family protein [Streptomyces sp. DSM 15324]|uniref:transposase family protein n=1 Tax=Streptomyces sp. DSM 15324 TaxID=1739111 RepID=UPI003B633A64